MPLSASREKFFCLIFDSFIFLILLFFLKLIDIYYFVNFLRKNNTNYIDMILFVHILISNKPKVGSNKPTGKTKINKKEYEVCL